MIGDINMKIIIERYTRMGARGFINNPLHGLPYTPIHSQQDILNADSDTSALHMLIENETYRQLQSQPKINIEAFRI
jgi:hypothetical protein